jgi:neutral ceramidase
MHRLTLVLILFGSALAAPSASTWRAGIAAANITPSEPLWLAGYASRTNPAEGKAMDLWIKILALEDAGGHRAIFLTSDTLGVPQSIYQHTCATLKKKFNLETDQILLSASHTHCGPVLRNALYDAYPLDERQVELINQYSVQLEAKIADTAASALADLAPARLASGQGFAGFAVNRRNNTEAKVPKLIEDGALKGPSDHSVPVLAVYLPDGKLKAVLFGYACHNTTLGFNKWCGDYAGYAQLALERSHPGAAAMFFMGCGGDQNPLPRKRMELAERYGQMLASAVEEVLIAPSREPATSATKPPERSGSTINIGVAAQTNSSPLALLISPLMTLSATLKTSVEMVTLDFGPAPTEAELEQMRSATNNASHKRYASRLLAELKAGKRFPRTYPYPVQAWLLGDSQLLIGLGGEPVVDYSLKFKQQFGRQTWVAGYCNDVMTYIPSLRVLKEGGYEGGGAMVPYGQPALRWADDVEDLITSAAARLVRDISK